MKNLVIFFSILAVLLCEEGCCSLKGGSQQERTDSLLIEYRERIVKLTDTIYIEIPHQSAERTTQDSTSHLENDYALSDARINADGSLFHSLHTKPQQKPVPVEKEIHYRDSTASHVTQASKSEEIIKEVQKPLNWWQQTQIYGFWAALIFLAYHYRRKIIAAAVRVFLRK